MTELLKKALARLSALPDPEQDVVAARILAELDDEARWHESFAESQDLLEALAKEALEEDRHGKTLSGDW
jgi:hypothetical protein